jgi:Domain of unknown function (DUF4340)
VVEAAVKRPPFLGTYVAVAVLAALGAYIYFVELKRPDEAEKNRQKVFTLDKTKVESVGLSVTGQEDVQLVRGKDGWQMTAPMAVAADSGEADALVSTLEGLEMDGAVAESPSDPAEYGLAAPRATVTVRVQGSPAPLVLHVGDKTPDGSAVYARVASAPRVFTIPAYVEGSVTKKPFDLRDRSVLHVQRDAVTALDVSGPEGAYALAKDEKGEWSFVRPLRTRAGRWSVDALVGTLENLRMEAVAAEAAADLRKFGLAPPARTVTVHLAGGATRTLEIGNSPSEGRHHVHVAGSPLVAIVPGALAGDLAKGMGELRAKRLLEVAAYEVEGFDVETAGTKRVYVRTSSKDDQGGDVHKWKRTAPDAKDLETNKVQDALFAVGGLEVAEFVDAPKTLPPYGLDAPALRVTLRHAGGKPPVWFQIGTKDGASYARREADDAVMKLDPVKAAELIKAFSDL